MNTSSDVATIRYEVGQEILSGLVNGEDVAAAGDRREIRRWPGFLVAVYEVVEINERGLVRGRIVEVVDETATE